MRLFSIYSLVLINLTAFSQSYVEEFDSFDPWLGQTIYDYKFLKKFDQYCRDHSLMVGPFAMIDNGGDNTWSYMRTVDLNNDNLLDVVYNGPSGGEPYITIFFIQTQTGFEKVFSETQGVSRVEWENDLLNKVYTSDWGCCAEIRLINTVYSVHYDMDRIPTFDKVYQTVELNDGLVKPKSYFEKPKKFAVKNQTYKLRFEPKIDDDSEFSFIDLTGNTIATLKKGATGQAFASQTDDTGRVWWYVAIDPSKKIVDCLIKVYDYYPTHVIGWISSRYVEEIIE